MNKLSLWSVTFLTVLPALLCACFIKSYAVNVVFWDEWLVANDLDRFYSGTLTTADLFAQHNEHRIFFPRLLMLAIGHWTGFDTRACMWATWMMLCLLAVALYSMLSSTAADRRSALVRFLPVSWLVFNWRQHENLLWGFQVTLVLMMLCLVGAIYLLDKSEGIGGAYWLAIISGVVGSFSFANGLLIWPIGLLQIAGQHYLGERRFTKRLGWQAGIWTLSGLAVYALYFWKYQKPGHHPSLLFFFKDFTAAIEYFLVYWGGSLAGEARDALAAGALLLAVCGYTLFLLLFQQKLPRTSLKFFSLILFAELSGITLVAARLGFGAEQALSSRYVIFSSCGLIGCFALTQLVESKSHKRGLQCFLAGLVLFGALSSYLNGQLMAQRHWVRAGERAFLLRSYRCQPDAKLLALYPAADLIRQYGPILEKHHLNVFRRDPGIGCQEIRTSDVTGVSSTASAPTEKQSQTDGWVESINNQPASSELTVDSEREAVIKLSGWAVDREAGGPPSAVFINVDGQWDFPATDGQERMDVALYFSQPAYLNSGFVASLPTAKLGVGKHRLSLKIITVNRRQYYQPKQICIVDLR